MISANDPVTAFFPRPPPQDNPPRTNFGLVATGLLQRPAVGAIM
jgi:hypothetical protein